MVYAGEPLGGVLRQLRNARGLSLAQAARLAGASKGSVADWEAGRHRPSPDALARLLGALGAEPETPAPALDHLGPPVALGTVLRGLRLRHGSTQAGAAQRVGVGQSAWAKWESGDVLPTADTLARALDALGASGAERSALRVVAGAAGAGDLEARTWEVEHFQPVAIRDILLLGLQAEAWRQAAGGSPWGEAMLCRVVSARAQQCMLRGDLAEIEPLTRLALALAARTGEFAPATAAVSAAEWLRGRDPQEAMASAHSLGRWAERLGCPRHRYWARSAQALALARAGEGSRAGEILDRIDDEGGEAKEEAAFHRSDRAEAHLLADEPERAMAQVQELGDLVTPIVAAKAHLAMGLRPPEKTLEAARVQGGAHWFYGTDLARVERALARLDRGRRARFR